MWSKTKTNSKAGFDKVYTWVDKLGAPVNRLSNKVGSEAFWPTTLDVESDKAARILKSFCSESSCVWIVHRADSNQRMASIRKKIDRRVPRPRKESREYSKRYHPR
jgi:hypothetical protein